MQIRCALLVATGALALGLAGGAVADDVGGETVEVTPPPPEAGDAEEPAAEHDFTRDGWYAQGQFAYGLENFDEVEADDAFGGNFALGYRFHPLGAMDVEFEYLDQFDFDGPAEAQVNSSFNVSLNGRLYPLATLFDPASLANRFQPFLKLGVAWMWVREQDPDASSRNNGAVAGRFGAGLDVYLTQKIVLTLSGNYMLPNNSIEDRQYTSVGAGLQYRFGDGGD
jgi:opacity protein-like surface antigen